MKEKEKLIIQAAIKLFAAKGYTSTSIQEIATESGISKGSFYMYFKSKEALMLAIFQYYYHNIKDIVSFYEKMELPPRERFINQLTGLLETLTKHKEIMIMQTKEQAIPLNDSIKKLIYKMHLESLLFFQKGLESIYGKKIQSHLWDLSLIMESIFNSYVRVIFFAANSVKFNDLCEYMLRRMDSIVKDIEKEQVLITQQKMEDILDQTKVFFFEKGLSIQNILKKLKDDIDDVEDNEDLKVSFEVLEAEIQRESPRIPVIKGMLTNFKRLKQFDDYHKKIASIYKF